MKKFALAIMLSFIAATALATSNLSTTRINLPAFNVIKVSGNVNLLIQGMNSSRSRDTLTARLNPQWVAAKVKNHVLYLRTLRGARSNRKAATVKVGIYQLDKLVVNGRASVTGSRIQSNGLVLKANTVGNITLNGKFIVDRIQNEGPGNVNLRWVSGRNIKVRCDGSGRVTLAGTAKTLRATLEDHTTLNARYLRAKEVLIKTQDYALAKVLPIISLRAFAGDYSNIYFYKSPKYINRDTKESGNILRRRSRH